MSKRWNSDYHIILYGIITILVLIVWPRTQGLRFFIPLLPFYISFALTGLEKCYLINNQQWKVFGKIICIFAVVIILIFFLRSSIINSYENILNQRKDRIGPYLSTSKKVFSYISKNTETDSIIVFRKPRVMRLYTDRQSIMVHQVNKLARGDYLCISLVPDASDDQIINDDVVSLRENGRIQLVYQNMDFELYQIKNRQAQD